MTWPMLALLALLWSPTAAAQDVEPSRFTPLEIGDRWEYVRTMQQWPEGEEPGEPTLEGYVRTEVTGDTLINGERHLILSQERLSSGGARESSYFCAIRVLDSGDVVFPDRDGVEGMCERWDAIDHQLSTPVAAADGDVRYRADSTKVPGAIVVSGVQYDVAATTVRLSGKAHGAYWRLDYAADVGLYRWTDYEPPRHADGYLRVYELAYARVGDETYGARLDVAVEATPLPSVAVLSIGSPSPNPSAGMVRFDIEGPDPGDTLIEVFDTRGALVHTTRAHLQRGHNVITLELPTISAGAYVVQVVDAAGRRGSTTLIRF